MEEIILSNVPTGNLRSVQALEKHLEDWIERDPSLVQDGLCIVGRQVHVEAGFVDLLGIDPAGRLVVIEIKKGNVRRETVLQAAAYATCIHEMDEAELRAKIDFYLTPKETDLDTVLGEYGLDDEIIFKKREVVICVVGTGRDQNLKGMTNASSFKDYPINLIHFDVVENEAHESVLVHKLTQLDTSESAHPKPKRRRTKRAPAIKTHAIERMLRLAEQNGIGEEFRLIHEEAMKHGLYPRLYRWSIMYAPPQNRTRCLVCVWAITEKPGLRVYIASRVFAEFYPISEKEAIACIGRDRWDRFQFDQALDFTRSLANLFQVIADNSENR